MTADKIKAQNIKPHLATLILIGIILLGGLIVFFWAIGLGVITDVFAYLNLLQKSPPLWVEAPVVMSRFLLLPSVTIFGLVFIITKIHPEPKVWSRFIVISILLILTVRYVQWRLRS